MSQEQLSLIAQYFIQLSEAEIDLSVTKKVLNEKMDFAPASLFSHISKDKEAITSLDLMEFINSFGDAIEYNTAFKLIFSISASTLCRLKLKEFLDFVCEPDYWTHMYSKKFYGNTSYATKFLMYKLFKKELGILDLIEQNKKTISSKSEISIHSLFYAICTNGKKYISSDNFVSFIRAHGSKPFMSNIAINALISRLDKDKDGMVNFIDFFDSIKFMAEEKEHLYDTSLKQSMHAKVQTPFKEEFKPVQTISPPKAENPEKAEPAEMLSIAKKLNYEEAPKSNDPKLFSEDTKKKIQSLNDAFNNLLKESNNANLQKDALIKLNEAKEAINNSFIRIEGDVQLKKKEKNENIDSQPKEEIKGKEEAPIQETPIKEAPIQETKIKEEQNGDDAPIKDENIVSNEIPNQEKPDEAEEQENNDDEEAQEEDECNRTA